jgi:hypothetical protein
MVTGLCSQESSSLSLVIPVSEITDTLGLSHRNGPYRSPNPPRDGRTQIPGERHLSHLEASGAGMPDDFHSDPDPPGLKSAQQQWLIDPGKAKRSWIGSGLSIVCE